LPKGSSAHYGRISVLKGSVQVCSDCISFASQDRDAVVSVDGRSYVIEAGKTLSLVMIANFALGLSDHGILMKSGCEGHSPKLVNFSGTMNNDVLCCLECGKTYVRTQLGYRPTRKRLVEEVAHLAELAFPPVSARVPLFDQCGHEHRVWTVRSSCGDHTPISFRVVPGEGSSVIVCNKCGKVHEVSDKYPNILVATGRWIDRSQTTVDSIFTSE
jgi:uncharacterized protein YbaR (Trm112 family)